MLPKNMTTKMRGQDKDMIVVYGEPSTSYIPAT